MNPKFHVPEIPLIETWLPWIEARAIGNARDVREIHASCMKGIGIECDDITRLKIKKYRLWHPHATSEIGWFLQHRNTGVTDDLRIKHHPVFFGYSIDRPPQI